MMYHLYATPFISDACMQRKAKDRLTWCANREFPRNRATSIVAIVMQNSPMERFVSMKSRNGPTIATLEKALSMGSYAFL